MKSCNKHVVKFSYIANNCTLCEAEEMSKLPNLIKKWRDEANLVKKQLPLPWSESWKMMDVEKIHCLEKCANELEALLN